MTDMPLGVAKGLVLAKVGPTIKVSVGLLNLIVDVGAGIGHTVQEAVPVAKRFR